MRGLPETMRAAYVDRHGPAESIRYGELPVPAPGPTDVLVTVEAVAVDPVDTFVRSGAFRTPTPFPFVIGRDLVGAVAARSEGAPGFAVGDRVWANSLGHGGRQGSFAEYAVVAADRLYHLPEGVDPLQAVALAHPAATAFLGLFRHARLRFDETVFIGGGAGNVGSAAIRLAAAAGARVLASAREEDSGRCREAGATIVVDYRDPDRAALLRAAAPDGVDVHWDTSGHHDLDAAAGLVARGGRIVLSAGKESRPELPAGSLYTADVTLVGFAMSNASVADLAAAAAVINRRLADGTLSARIAGELPLSEAAEAHRRIERGELSGTRLILRPEARGGSTADARARMSQA